MLEATAHSTQLYLLSGLGQLAMFQRACLDHCLYSVLIQSLYITPAGLSELKTDILELSRFFVAIMKPASIGQNRKTP